MSGVDVSGLRDYDPVYTVHSPTQEVNLTLTLSAPQQHTLRESWLQAAVVALTPLFNAVDLEVPPIRISVGFPGGRGPKTSVIGQCWNSHSSADKVHQIFIHPSLDDVEQILGVVMHELVHAIDDCESGHKGAFVKMVRALGLAGKPTATEVGEELAEELKPIIEILGEYPHAVLGSFDEGGAEGPKKQGTRMLKVECPEDGYIVRTTRKWLEIGVPTCPCGTEMEVIEPDEDAA